nr:hypothetical protein CFP56_00278 [Quercus suber]
MHKKDRGLSKSRARCAWIMRSLGKKATNSLSAPTYGDYQTPHVVQHLGKRMLQICDIGKDLRNGDAIKQDSPQSPFSIKFPLPWTAHIFHIVLIDGDPEFTQDPYWSIYSGQYKFVLNFIGYISICPPGASPTVVVVIRTVLTQMRWKCRDFAGAETPLHRLVGYIEEMQINTEGAIVQNVNAAHADATIDARGVMVSVG